jgi:hypothetical protein
MPRHCSSSSRSSSSSCSSSKHHRSKKTKVRVQCCSSPAVQQPCSDLAEVLLVGLVGFIAGSAGAGGGFCRPQLPCGEIKIPIPCCPTIPVSPLVDVNSAQFSQIGAQPATVTAGQPFTFSSTNLVGAGITSMTGLFSPPFTLAGTVFTLAKIGRYEVRFRMSFPSNGAIVLYQGQTLATMTPSLLVVGKTTDGQASDTQIIETTTVNSFLSLNAAAGNTAGIVIPALSSTTNTNATTLSIKFLPPLKLSALC